MRHDPHEGIVDDDAGKTFVDVEIQRSIIYEQLQIFAPDAEDNTLGSLCALQGTQDCLTHIGQIGFHEGFHIHFATIHVEFCIHSIPPGFMIQCPFYDKLWDSSQKDKTKGVEMLKELKNFALTTSLVALLQAFMPMMTQARAQEANSSPEFKEVLVERVTRDPRSAQPVVILSNVQRKEGMLIWIGEAEARALEAAKQQVVHQRPMTHDLLSGILRELDAHIIQVRITELKNNIFYARILIQTGGGQVEIDARPSDAMVLALKASCPILVEDSLFEDQSLPLDLPPLRLYGLDVQELTDELKSVLGYEGEGILVAQVDPNSPAGRDGILREDILVHAGGKPLNRVEDFEKVLSEAHGNLEIRVFRGGAIQPLTLNVSPES
jgi:bifunctional DNase/RNase